MPVVKDAVKSKGGARQRIETNNQIELTPKAGTARFVIMDIWLYPCNERGKYEKHNHAGNATCTDECPVTGTKSKWSLQHKKNPAVVLENRMLCGLGPKSKFQQRIGLLTGTEPGSDACKAINTDDLVGREVLCTYALGENGYTDIKEVMPTEDDEPAPAEIIETVPPPEAQPRGNDPRARVRDNPPQAKAPEPDPLAVVRAGTPTPKITPRQQAEIDSLLAQAYEKGWTPETVRKNCLKVSDGATDETAALSAIEANRFFTGLRAMLFKSNRGAA